MYRDTIYNHHHRARCNFGNRKILLYFFDPSECQSKWNFCTKTDILMISVIFVNLGSSKLWKEHLNGHTFSFSRTLSAFYIDMAKLNQGAVVAEKLHCKFVYVSAYIWRIASCYLTSGVKKQSISSPSMIAQNCNANKSAILDSWPMNILRMCWNIDQERAGISFTNHTN